MQYENNLRKKCFFFLSVKQDLIFKKPFPKGTSGKKGVVL